MYVLIRTLVVLFLVPVVCGHAHAEIRVLDRPMWVFPGQTFRIALEQPAGNDTLSATVPDNLEMFDTWPKDTVQRFYFRATRPGKVTVRFDGSAGRLDLAVEVIPWSDVLAPRRHGDIQLPRIWPMSDPGYRQLKSRRTLHTEEDMAALRDREPGRLAREWAARSDEEIFNIVPGPSVARTCLIVLGGYEDPRGKGCPVCGTDVYKGTSAFYPWKFDPEGHPWKVGCPSCGTWFPSNDYRSGDMHSGPFPDDGFGCEPVEPVYAPNGKPWRWPFIAYYHQTEAYMRELTRGIPQCAEAYAATGDPVYAHKAAVGLFKMAESLLDLSVNMNHRKLPVRNGVYQPPVGAPDQRAMARVNHTFLYIQPNWDTPRLERCAEAWDLIFDALEGDEALLAFCRSQYHPEIRTLEDFRRFVESGVIRVTAQACLDDAISRNYPMQEVTVATMALGLGTPETEALVDWVLNGPGGIRFGLTNEYYKDGAGHESESYNGIQIRDMTRLLKLLERIIHSDPERYRPPRFVSPIDDPKFRGLYDFPLDDSLIGRTYPSTGDTGGPTTAPRREGEGYPVRRRSFLEPYVRTRDPKFAQALYGPDGDVPSSVRDTTLCMEIERIGKERGWQVATKSGFLDGFGHAILRSGSGENQRALWMRYGRSVQHAHADMLTFGFAALKRDMLPELGYPRGWTYARVWESGWATHYGTHIVGVSSRQFGLGRLTLFADAAPARIAVAESRTGDGERRQRTVVLVDRPDGGCYAVSLERVAGGAAHHHSYHTPDGEATPFGVDLKPQSGGTVLGAGYAYGDDASVASIDRELAPYAYMYDVSRGRPAGIWGLDVKLRGQNGVGLRTTFVYPDDARVAVAKGKPPGGGANPYEMAWCILQRQGAPPLASQFLYVMEPYETAPAIARVERVAVSPVSRPGPFVPLALRVVGPGFTDLLVFQADVQSECRAPDGTVVKGAFGFIRRPADGGPAEAVLADGGKLETDGISLSLADSPYRGRIASCDWAARTIRIQPVPENVDALVGRHVQIHNDRGSHTSYAVVSASKTGDACDLALDLDPRIGEGFVSSWGDGEIESHVRLRMDRLRTYYDGKTIANEDGSAVYRLAEVRRGRVCVIDRAGVDAARMRRVFSDRNGDGLVRYVIYDYGPGDEVTIRNWASTRALPAP